MLLKSIPVKLIYALAFIFIAINSVLIYFEFFWFSLLPAALALFFLSVFALDKVLWFVVLATPLSFSLENLEIGGIGMFVPTEPLMFMIMVIFFFRLISDQTFDRKILLHPLTVAILDKSRLADRNRISPVQCRKFLLSSFWRACGS